MLVVCVAFTVCVPEDAPWPRPTIDTFVASVVFHVSTELPPGAIVLGLAVIVAIGAGAVSGAAGGLGEAVAPVSSYGIPRSLASPPDLLSQSGTCDLNIARVSPPSRSVIVG